MPSSILKPNYHNLTEISWAHCPLQIHHLCHASLKTILCIHSSSLQTFSCNSPTSKSYFKPYASKYPKISTLDSAVTLQSPDSSPSFFLSFLISSSTRVSINHNSIPHFITLFHRGTKELAFHHHHQYYNLRYNPSAPFVCSGFLVSYRIRSAIKTTAPRTAPHLKYIQGIGIPNKASFEILAMNTGLNWIKQNGDLSRRLIM